MSQETKVILDMLQNGKISSEEAQRLLKAVNRNEDNQTVSSNNSNNGHADIDFSSMLNSFGNKINNAVKNLQPVLSKAASTVIEKSADAAESISKALSEGSSSRHTAAKPAKSKEFDVLAENVGSRLELRAINGNLKINGYNGNRLTLKVNYSTSSPDDISLTYNDSICRLDFNEACMKELFIEALIPNGMFETIWLSDLNGKVDIVGLNCQQLQLEASDAAVTIQGAAFEKADIDTNNSNISINGMHGSLFNIEGFGGKAALSDVDYDSLNLSVTNSEVSLSIDKLMHHNNYKWKIDAANSGMTIKFNNSDKIAYNINAQALLSEVAVALKNLEYEVNNGSAVQARSFDFDSSKRRIFLECKASNFPISIS